MTYDSEGHCLCCRQFSNLRKAAVGGHALSTLKTRSEPCCRIAAMQRNLTFKPASPLASPGHNTTIVVTFDSVKHGPSGYKLYEDQQRLVALVERRGAPKLLRSEETNLAACRT